MGLVRETLAAEAVLPNSSIDYEEAFEVIQRTLPDVVLVGFSENVDRAVEFGRELLKEQPKLTLVALARTSEATTILAAMRVGYKEFAVLPTEADRLRDVVHSAAFSPAEEGEKGLVVALTGAKGGVGTTLLATHLAAELASIHRVVCMDCDFIMGDIAPHMDLIPKDTLADLLPRADRIDERMLTGSVMVHPSKVHFLCQPDDLDRLGEVRAEDVFNIINAAAKGYQYVVVDCGNDLYEPAAIALNVADQVFVVATPDVVAIRDAHRKIQALQSVGIEKKRISLIINRMPEKPFLSLDDIEQNIHWSVMATIADDPATVGQAVNEGTLVRDVSKSADITRDISQLVSLLAEDPDEIQPIREVRTNRGFLARLFGRG